MTHERAARSLRRSPAPQHSWPGIARVRRDTDITGHSNAPARPAPSSGQGLPLVSSSRGSSYLELWVWVMPRLNDAKSGAS